MSMLTDKQKAQLCILARKGWDAWASADWEGGINAGVSNANLFRAWRTQEQKAACGQMSLRMCFQEDFPKLMSHFARLAGDDKLERYWTGKLVEDGRGRVLYILKQNCDLNGLAYPDYPGAICRRQYKCGLGAATEKQLWGLVYTVRNRGQAKKNKGVNR